MVPNLQVRGKLEQDTFIRTLGAEGALQGALQLNEDKQTLFMTLSRSPSAASLSTSGRTSSLSFLQDCGSSLAHPSLVSAVKCSDLLDGKAVLYSKQTVTPGASPGEDAHPGMAIRRQGDRYVLVEYGEMVLDLRLRVRVQFLENLLLNDPARPAGIHETAPGVRSLQIRYDFLQLPLESLIEYIVKIDSQIGDVSAKSVPTRVFYLPMCFDSPGCKEAMDRYSRSFRDDAPYLPSNVEYVAKNNGLYTDDGQPDVAAVKKRVFRASYLCLGLGDVYLGACCAVPVDPMDRLITTKMNPARVWTEEGTVGLGGAYMCIYPMYSPGGYQLVGRTLPIWNSFGLRQPEIFSKEKPWFLEMFDQIRYYEVGHEELERLRVEFVQGVYTPRIEKEDFSLVEHARFLEENKEAIALYQKQQKLAMAEQNEEDARSLARIAVRELQEGGKEGGEMIQMIPCPQFG